MRRIRLTIAYDGTNYVGWQIQPNGVSVEEVLNAALSKLLGENVQVIGASRTDSGVHADGNLCVFDTESRIPADKFRFALNEFLPDDVKVQASNEVPLLWHPRKINSVKTYEYRILNRRIPLPKERNYSYFYYYDLDVARMAEAAEVLLGEHDFTSFASLRGSHEDPVRRIYRISVTKEGDMITLRVSGSGFLFNMVRIIAGTLIRIGAGLVPENAPDPERKKMAAMAPAELMSYILEARDRSKAGPKAPACGLTLKSIVEEPELPEGIDEDNPHWGYRIDYSGLKRGQEEVPIRIMHCDPADHDALVLRLTKQASRNGARYISLRDETGLLKDGEQLQYFTYHEQPDGSFLTGDPRKQEEKDNEEGDFPEEPFDEGGTL